MEHRDVGLQIQACTTDTGVHARPMPTSLISPPSVDSTELAARTALHLRAVPEAPVDAVADALLRTFPADTQSSEIRAVGLALDFSIVTFTSMLERMSFVHLLVVSNVDHMQLQVVECACTSHILTACLAFD